MLIDESEQVLAHLLSRTLEGKRKHVTLALIHILGKAKRIVAADADLSWPSFNFIKKWAEARGRPRSAQIVINKYATKQGKIDVFESENHLIGDFVTSLNAGKRCYFTSNSKELIGDVAEQLKQECPEASVLVVTSDETAAKDPAAAAFIKNPSAEAGRYHAVLTSPSIGSGVDITFNGDERFYDIVYGLFVPQVLTHFECDQQLGRVRHPKQVKVYVSPATAAFETNLGVVLRDAQAASILDANVEGYTDDQWATPVYRDDPLSEIAAAIISSQRASKNQLWRNFLHYKRQQGWDIEHIGPHDEIAHLGHGVLANGKERRAKFLVNRLMQAKPLSDDEYQRIDHRIRNYEFANDGERANYERSAIEAFYNQPISDELIVLDDRGRFRSCVGNFEMMNDARTAEVHRDGIDDPERRDQAAMLIPNAAMRRILLMETLSTTPIYRDFMFTPEVKFGKADLKPFIAWMNDNRIAIQQQFDIALHKGLDNNPITQLRPFLEMVGLDLVKLPKTRKGGATLVPFQISQASLDLMMQLISYRKIKDVSKSLRHAA